MILMTLKQYHERALQEGWALGHFNVSELDQMRAIVEACKEMCSPAIIGTSEGERAHLGLLEAVALRDLMRKEYDLPIFLNADHSKSIAAAQKAIDAGYDSVHIDLSALPFEENIRGTRDVVEYARVKCQISNVKCQISVEGELGYLRGESKIQKEKIAVKPEDYTKPEEAEEFVKKTGVDRLAIVAGNVHGLSFGEPNIDIKRIRDIRKAVSKSAALVLHGGSGIPDDQIKAAIQAGIANVHINTDLRVAYVRELKKSLEEHADEVAMYKLDHSAIQAMKELVGKKLKLFGSIGKI